MLALAFLCALPARADYEAGRQAPDARRADEALAQWRAAADAGDRRAMLALGRLYAQGLGAPQDYVEAHKWFNLAASRGEMTALVAGADVNARVGHALADAADETHDLPFGGKHLIDSFADELRDGFGPACRRRLEKLVLACLELDPCANHDGISALEAMNGKFPVLLTRDAAGLEHEFGCMR